MLDLVELISGVQTIGVEATATTADKEGKPRGKSSTGLTVTVTRLASVAVGAAVWPLTCNLVASLISDGQN
jgi:hypothetical protein